MEAEIRQKLIAKQQEMLKLKEMQIQKQLEVMKRKLGENSTTTPTSTTENKLIPPAKVPSKEEIELKNALDRTSKPSTEVRMQANYSKVPVS